MEVLGVMSCSGHWSQTERSGPRAAAYCVAQQFNISNLTFLPGKLK